MAPEAYLHEALLATVARSGVDAAGPHRAALAAAYARYQHISRKAADAVFAGLPPED
jgi:hypothetical protein